MKTKPDEYLKTCKRYMNSKGLGLDISTHKKISNLYNTYMEKFSAFFYLLTQSCNIIVVISSRI